MLIVGLVAHMAAAVIHCVPFIMFTMIDAEAGRPIVCPTALDGAEYRPGPVMLAIVAPLGSTVGFDWTTAGVTLARSVAPIAVLASAAVAPAAITAGLPGSPAQLMLAALLAALLALDAAADADVAAPVALVAAAVALDAASDRERSASVALEAAAAAAASASWAPPSAA